MSIVDKLKARVFGEARDVQAWTRLLRDVERAGGPDAYEARNLRAIREVAESVSAHVAVAREAERVQAEATIGEMWRAELADPLCEVLRLKRGASFAPTPSEIVERVRDLFDEESPLAQAFRDIQTIVEDFTGDNPKHMDDDVYVERVREAFEVWAKRNVQLEAIDNAEARDAELLAVHDDLGKAHEEIAALRSLLAESARRGKSEEEILMDKVRAEDDARISSVKEARRERERSRVERAKSFPCDFCNAIAPRPCVDNFGNACSTHPQRFERMIAHEKQAASAAKGDEK